MVVTSIAFWLALVLRFETFDKLVVDYRFFDKIFFITLLIFSISFLINGLYKGVWRFSSTYDLIRVIRSTVFGTIASIAFWSVTTRMEGIPRSLFPIQFFLLIVGLGGGRFFYRYLKDQTALKSVIGGADDSIKNVLIVGAGRAGEKLVRDINSTPKLKLKVLGIIDDDRFKKNALIQNVKVHGGVELIPNLCKQLSIEKIFIAIPSADSTDVKRIVSFCKETNAEIKILPKMDHLLSSQVEISLLRNLNIEDLLGREQVQLDLNHLNKMISGKTILVTGAGGSIGSEVCRQISKFNPSIIVLADYCELFMYELEMEFRENFKDIKIFPKIVDVRNVENIEQLFNQFKPQIVFHAAAYKHVPMMEYNPMEAIGTNVVGTQIVAEASLRHNVERFVMISTDKAVNPTNVMGASKRIAEMVVADLSIKSNITKFISVRFGNVLGSNGSVIPLFRKQIESRMDITVTHPEIIRYFMSIPEATQLVLQAGSMGQGGEIFVLDMGEPVKIVDLAREMIRLAGLIEGKDINIIFSGLRPGEKLYEELFSDEENFEHTEHGKIRIALQRKLDSDFLQKLKTLTEAKSENSDLIIHLMKSLVPEFSHYRLKELENDSKHLNS
jgi:FlaA1/EpsC-like NDP-sugar epimerase